MVHRIPPGRKNRSLKKRNGIVRTTRKPSGNYTRNPKTGSGMRIARRTSSSSRRTGGVIGRKRHNGRKYR